MLSAAPASAQVDLTGTWAARRTVRQRRRAGTGRSAGHAAQRRRPREGAELRHRVALGDRAPVPDVPADLRDHRSVPAAVLDGAGPGHAEAARPGRSPGGAIATRR